jgi:2-polyprenyl-3-methyl-5-hydroxy-6-metoxy-1,4-benzoquinol methylase
MPRDVAGYDHYQSLKGWHEDTLFAPRDGGYFETELKGFTIGGAEVLEIGFGAGHCLAWLARKGARARGIEIQEALVRTGRARGFDTFLPDSFDWASVKGKLDLILGFDVLEHLSDSEIVALLRRGTEALKPGGTMVFRFPNASSPFGLHYLAADPTHVTPLSGPRLTHLISTNEIRGLTLEQWRDQRLMPARGLARRLGRALSHTMRAATRLVLHHGYLRGQPIPLAMNAIVVLRKTNLADA